MPCAAKCRACWDEPHCRSTVTPGTDSGSPAESHAVRATLNAWAPSCEMQPKITSSTTSGSNPARSTSLESTAAPRSAEWISESPPPRLPIGVRRASTM
jgi:hypothetical protein